MKLQGTGDPKEELLLSCHCPVLHAFACEINKCREMDGPDMDHGEGRYDDFNPKTAVLIPIQIVHLYKKSFMNFTEGKKSMMKETSVGNQNRQ